MSAAALGLPAFAVVGPPRRPNGVHLGWVEDWGDACEPFPLQSGGTRPRYSEALPSDSNILVATGTDRKPAPARPGQRAFQFRVLQRYGPKCDACGLPNT